MHMYKKILQFLEKHTFLLITLSKKDKNFEIKNYEE